MKKFKLIPMLVLMSFVVFAQTGDEFFDKKDYHNAIIKYQTEVLNSPSKYLNLAKSYFALQEFDDAITAMKNYKAKYSSADKKVVDEWIKLLSRKDDYVEVTNAGSLINSSQSDYFPVVSIDGDRLYFTSNGRTGGYGGEDVWYCEKKEDGSWGEPQNLKDLNTNSHEAIMSMSGDGNVVIIFGNYEGSFGGGDLFYTVKTSKGWTNPCNLGGTINSENWEAQANLAPDGRTLLFCSTRSTGKGNSDIYVTQLSDEGWSKPINLGSTINTSGTDAAPMLAADGKTLYFFSDGHPGFGGTDIFMAKRKGDSWTEWTTPVNLGKYINTMEDDKYLSIPSSGINAYTVRKNQIDGFGSMDIYEFIMPPSMRPEMVVNVSGVVSDNEANPVSAKIKFYDSETGKEYANAISNFNDGVYKISLPPLKKYNVVIDMKGFLYKTDVLDLTDMNQFVKEESMSVKLKNEMPEILAAKKKFEELNKEFSLILENNTLDISNGFITYEKLISDYKQNSKSLDMAIKKSKLSWLSEENELLDIVKNFTLQTIEEGATFELKNIFFDFGKATLTTESKTELDKLADILSRTEINIEIGGHSDNVGSDEANLKLSQDRVNSVKEYLVAKGIKEKRIAAVGYGEKNPIASNETEEGRKKNRRVEVKITKVKGREGSDVVTEKDRKKDKKEEVISEFDFLETLRSAARKGGLPKNSPCSDEITFVKNTYTPQINTKKESKFNLDFLDFLDVDWDEMKIEKDEGDYFYKTFNPSFQNFGFAMPKIKSNYGVGVNLVNDNLTEFHGEYYFLTPDTMKFQAGAGFLWNWQPTKYVPLLLSLGLNANYVQYNNLIKDKDYVMMVNMPLGLRLPIALNEDFVIGPEYFIYYGSGNAEQFGGDHERERYKRYGINVRYKMFQGGFHINKGKENPYVDYKGFRLGFAF